MSNKFFKVFLSSALFASAVYLLHRILKRRRGPVVKQLHIFPVKSCSGMSVTEWEIDERGFKFDRNWMIVNEKSKRCLTQREQPKLVLIKAHVTKDGYLTLSAPQKQDLHVGFPKDYEKNERIKVSFYKEEFEGIDMGDENAKWLSDVLGQKVRLVMNPPDFQRVAPPDATRRFFEREKLATTGKVRYTDAFPFHLGCMKSLEALSNLLDTPIEMLRFRPNIVVEGTSKPFEEDTWEKVMIGENIFYHAMPCSRCTIPNVNLKTGEKDEEPRKTLLKYRSGTTKVTNEKGNFFGIYLVHQEPGKKIKVGDDVSVLSYQEGPEIEDPM